MRVGAFNRRVLDSVFLNILTWWIIKDFTFGFFHPIQAKGKRYSSERRREEKKLEKLSADFFVTVTAPIEVMCLNVGLKMLFEKRLSLVS